jgi:hypothetical protein
VCVCVLSSFKLPTCAPACELAIARLLLMTGAGLSDVHGLGAYRLFILCKTGDCLRSGAPPGSSSLEFFARKNKNIELSGFDKVWVC